MKPWTWKDLALAVLGNLFTAALTFLLTITISRQLDMDTRLILLALAAFALAGSALMAFFLKRQGLRLCESSVHSDPVSHRAVPDGPGSAPGDKILFPHHRAL